MKIAYILPSLAKMGPTLVAYDLATSMLQRGHEVCVYYFDELRENTVKFPCPTLRISFRHRFDMEKFDVVHSHMLRPDLYIWLYRPCRKNTHTRFITTIHSFVMQDLTSMYNRLVAFIFGNLWMLLLHCFDMRVVLSNEAKHYYLRWFRSEQLTCVYNTRTLNCEKNLQKMNEKN